MQFLEPFATPGQGRKWDMRTALLDIQLSNHVLKPGIHRQFPKVDKPGVPQGWGVCAPVKGAETLMSPVIVTESSVAARG